MVAHASFSYFWRSPESFHFITGNRYCQLFSLEWWAHLVGFYDVCQYPGVGNHDLSVNFLPRKTGMKPSRKGNNSYFSLEFNLINAFPWNNHSISVFMFMFCFMYSSDFAIQNINIHTPGSRLNKISYLNCFVKGIHKGNWIFFPTSA